MLLQISECTGLSVPQIQDLLNSQNLRERYETGEVDSNLLYQIFQSSAKKPFTAREFYYAASDIFTPNEPIYPLVYSLKEQGLRLVLLSNTSPAHFEFISNRYPVLNHFDAKILSYEVRACKPDPHIYRAAIEAALCSPQECFYTDDIPEYIEGAKEHGIDAEIFQDVPTLKMHLSKRFLL